MWKYLHRSVKNEGTVERLTNLNLFTNHRFKFYSTLKEQSFWRISFKRRSKVQKWVLSTGIVSFIAFNIWWVYWPHHTFPKPVAKILRKGLHSEIKKEGANYQKSLEYYLEALEECKAENVDLLSDEYTGIEIKIGEMYEKLHMYNDATALYGDMLKKFYNELSKTTDKSTKRKFFLLKRDLQILVRFNEINKDSETNATLLIMHLLLAQREFLENSPEFKYVLSKSELLNNQQLDWKNFKGLPFIGKSKPDYQMHLNSKRKQELKIKEPESEQCVFMKELLTARDLYTRYCLNRNNLSGALNSKITTLEWMLLADSPLDDILLAQAELGSIFYLNSEKFEGSLYAIDNEPYKKSEPLELIRSRLQENQNSCLQYSADCYKSIISFANENQYPKVAMESEMDQRILKALSLAHYGIGVINLHKGRLRASKKELKKAIRISEMIRFNELIEEAQRELKKVDGTPI
ncbi:BDM_1a_G0032710.mRNA.1.CDS.1 [Saccharomyces cerevisiae]|nr:BDM_1a_G0032710.mRNA.1.CDS.1 [Saccharomyces cerevisiae]CAI7204171.1 BDM_1a_G0032710.mRNA.1.CDS.1 [Saccharomyces cerevisiae]